MKQKAISEERLNTDLVRVIESILGGAAVAEKTKNVVDTAGLADYTLYFQCDDGVSTYGLAGSSARTEDAVTPLFTPDKIKTTSLITWSLPYHLPFKVIDLLLLSSSNTQYYLLGTTPFADEFINATKGFNVEQIVSLDAVQPGKNYQLRIVDLTGSAVLEGNPVPASVEEMEDTRVTAVVFVGEREVNYFQKQGAAWKKSNPRPIPILSVDTERDAAKYAAIFAADGEQYQCNMRKAFRRLEYLSELSLLKIAEVQQYYEPRRGSVTAERCLNFLINDEGNMNLVMGTLRGRAQACRLDAARCADLPEAALAVARANTKLTEEGDCIPVY